MSTEAFELKKAFRFIPQIALVGLGIGTANYIMHGNLNWLQFTIQSLSTCGIIGFTLVAIGLNRSWFRQRFSKKWQMYLSISVLFLLIAFVATEIEHIIRSLVFQSEDFSLLSAGKMYLFNGIISMVLGFSFFQFSFPSANKMANKEVETPSTGQETNSETELSSAEPVVSIPVKTRETISFIPVEEVVYFEAYDNYSFVYVATGEKKLCDYSLGFLEKRLGGNFSRVHRKYIVNERHIKQIKPHLNGRYVIVFNPRLEPITSSKGHANIIRKLIKLQ